MEGVGIMTLLVVALCLEVGLNTLVKAAINNGMSRFVFIVYSNAFALSFLLPSSFFYYTNRSFDSPSLTTSIIFRIFLLSFLSCAVQTLGYTGIAYSSPTLNSAMVDLTPAFTFIIAFLSGCERVNLKEKSSRAKSIGTVVCIIGALMITLYKGKAMEASLDMEWILGGCLLALSSFCISLLLIVKTWIMKEYPLVLMVATISCCFVVILSTIVALIAEKNSKAWMLHSAMELATILYSAIFVITMGNIVRIWACGKMGPLYVAMFTPLGMVIALIMGILFLGDTLYLGSVIGCGIIAIGFYGVIWGKAQEEKVVNERKGICSSPTTPLL